MARFEKLLYGPMQVDKINSLVPQMEPKRFTENERSWDSVFKIFAEYLPKIEQRHVFLTSIQS